MNTLDSLLVHVEQLHRSTPELCGFGPWPDDLVPRNVVPRACPVASGLMDLPAKSTSATRPLVQALCAAASHLHWKQTYTEAEVGADFLARYGYVELFGPDGHFQTNSLRGYLAVWGAGLTYDWHDHEAEELYFNLAGQAVFAAHGSPNIQLKPGQTRTHLTRQRHMMITLDHAIITYVVWRGAGLDGLPRMVVA